MNTSGLTYMIPVAVASATATLSGNLLGAGNTNAAWAVMKMGIIFDFMYGVVGAFFLISLRHQWGGLYTTDAAVMHLVARYMPSMAAYLVVDSMKCITLNILRSIGLPKITVVVNSVACLVILLPLGELLGVRLRLGIPGLWAAMSIAWGVAGLACAVVIGRTDWEEQARLIAARNKEGSRALEMEMQQQHM
jgi:MATE family multidrug resistance protein